MSEAGDNVFVKGGQDAAIMAGFTLIAELMKRIAKQLLPRYQQKIFFLFMCIFGHSMVISSWLWWHELNAVIGGFVSLGSGILGFIEVALPRPGD